MTRQAHHDRLRFDTTFTVYANGAEVAGREVVPAGTEVLARRTNDPRRAAVKVLDRPELGTVIAAYGLASHHPEAQYVELS